MNTIDIPPEEIQKIKKYFGINKILDQKPKGYYTARELVKILKLSERRIFEILQEQKPSFVKFHAKDTTGRNKISKAYKIT